MSNKQMSVTLLFDDGVVEVLVEPPDGLNDTGFEVWCDGVNSGITAYLQSTQQDRNFKKTQQKHKHFFKFVEPSDDNKILYFYCIECNELGYANRETLNKELLG